MTAACRWLGSPTQRMSKGCVFLVCWMARCERRWAVGRERMRYGAVMMWMLALLCVASLMRGAHDDSARVVM